MPTTTGIPDPLRAKLAELSRLHPASFTVLEMIVDRLLVKYGLDANDHTRDPRPPER